LRTDLLHVAPKPANHSSEPVGFGAQRCGETHGLAKRLNPPYGVI